MNSDRHDLRLRVNETLTLAAGSWVQVTQSDGECSRRIEAPRQTLFEQVMDYVASLPPAEEDRAPDFAEEAAATAALCFRWGSYLAVLMDPGLPPMQPLVAPAGDPTPSRIADGEMARIQVEASAALEHWIEIRRAEPSRYRSLVRSALHLPLDLAPRTLAPPPNARGRLASKLRLRELTDPELAQRLMAAVGDRWPEKHAEVDAAPTRVLANAIVNTCWRNGPVEDIHAGRGFAYPLRERRIDLAETRHLMETLIDRLAHACQAVHTLIEERSPRTWTQRVQPFHYVPMWLITPTGWSLSERTRETWLPGAEPAR